MIWGRGIGEQEGQHDIAQNHMGFVSHVFGHQISDVSYSLITALNHPVTPASQMITGARGWEGLMLCHLWWHFYSKERTLRNVHSNHSNLRFLGFFFFGENDIIIAEYLGNNFSF